MNQYDSEEEVETEHVRVVMASTEARPRFSVQEAVEHVIATVSELYGVVLSEDVVFRGLEWKFYPHGYVEFSKPCWKAIFDQHIIVSKPGPVSFLGIETPNIIEGDVNETETQIHPGASSC